MVLGGVILAAALASAEEMAPIGTGGMTMGSGASETHVSAKRADYDISRNVLVLDGNVVVRDPRVKIMADQITMLMSTNREPEMLTAVGSVDIEQDLNPVVTPGKKDPVTGGKGFRRATCGRAVYSVRSGITVLTDKPVITQEGMTLRGSRIIYSRDEDKVHIDNTSVSIMQGEGKDDVGDFMKSKNPGKPQN
jgi:lipopolysaccharide transport protein LptA